jgi:hypothetical protein
MSFNVISAQDIPTTTTRITKTFPLRTALQQLQIGEAIEVAYDTADEEFGYKATTISQVAGAMSARSDSIRYSVKRKPDGTGCYLIANAKPAPGTEKKRGRRSTKKAEVEA